MLEKISNIKYFDIIFKIMEDNFISDEYRNYDEQKELLNNPFYKLYMAKEQDEITAFVAIWEFDEFIFFEHLAVRKDKQNQGIGTKILNQLVKETSKNIVLEVELPKDELKQRRIEFYKRNGFILNKYNYVQPPMSKGKNFVPLLIMSTKKIENKDEFEIIKNILYKNVYKFTNN